MCAGEHFQVDSKTQYVDTMIAKCIDQYIAAQTAQSLSGGSSGVESKEGAAADGGTGGGEVDPRLAAIVERMFDRCFQDGAYKQALGVAIESLRLDKVEETINKSPDPTAMLTHCFDVCQTLVSNREFRLKVLAVLVKLHKEAVKPDFISMCQCLQYLGDHESVSEVLSRLVVQEEEGGDDMNVLVAYQAAFDLVENENQAFLMNVSNSMPTRPAAAAAGAGEDKTDDTDAAAATDETLHDDAYWGRMDRLKEILSGSLSIELYLSFLYHHNHADLLILKNAKDALPERNSVLHNATVAAHGFMHAGTTIDTFLRNNLDWLRKADHWAKFSAIGSLGVVHKGQLKQSMQLLQPYLPSGGATTSAYQEGGALYALGLIHTNKGGSGEGAVIRYLKEQLQAAGNQEDAHMREVIQHGSCLALGLAGMATGNEELFECLRDTLYQDSAVAGEAAGLAIGLTMLGTANETAIRDMLTYAHDTNHAKIIRGAAMGIALVMFGQEESAETLIEQLVRDKDPILRYGAMWTVGLAYAGTANNVATERLLHVAVSDVNDDVRRAAVTALGLVLYRTPEQLPRLVSLLCESYNPHVRYGACMAMGIAAAGSAMPEVIELLEPMLDDTVDFVRQGALIAMAMVLQQMSVGQSKKVKAFRDRLATTVADKHQPTMTKMGAILATGILDAGGRNMAISLSSPTGFRRMSAVVGIALFTQSWYWYPLVHMISLSFSPTAVMGVNKDIMLPSKFGVRCNAKPSLFEYPEMLKETVVEKKELVKTAVLSTTAKSKAKAAKKAREEGGDDEKEAENKDAASAMDVEEKGETKAVEVDAKASAAGVAKEKVVEPESFELANPSRVTCSQKGFIEFIEDGRYVPVRSAAAKTLGILVLGDSTPEAPEEVHAAKPPAIPGEEDEGDEPDPPEPFEWTPLVN